MNCLLSFSHYDFLAHQVTIVLFCQVGSFDHPMGDGWGLTSDDKHIVGSDGTATLYFMDPDTLRGTEYLIDLFLLRSL